MKTALIVGNGLTLSLLGHLEWPLNSSSPFSWNVPNPESEGLLIDALPGLKNFLTARMEGETDFELFGRLVASVNQNHINVLSGSNDIDNIILDAGHYLAIAFSWFQIFIDDLRFNDWEWQLWLAANRTDVEACLSWNYDLILERVIESIKTPIFYDVLSAGGTGASNFYPVDFNRRAIGVYKPHGSCNFSPDLILSWGNAPDDLDEHPKYPRRGLVTGYEGPMRILRTSELLMARDIADLVLPGERNRFRNEGNSGDHDATSRLAETAWSPRQIERFKLATSGAERLIIVGFSMSEVDKDEFLEAFSGLGRLKEVIVVDPSPNPQLMKLLKEGEVTVRTVNSIREL